MVDPFYRSKFTMRIARNSSSRHKLPRVSPEPCVRICSLTSNTPQLHTNAAVRIKQPPASCLIRRSERSEFRGLAVPIRMSDPKELHNGVSADSDEDNWKYQAPYKIYERGEGFDSQDIKHEASCHCGRVQYQLNREVPLDTKLCHCRDCQVQHGMLHCFRYPPDQLL